VNRLAHGLRRIRHEHGLTMSEMASLLGVHVATVSRIESGERLANRWNPDHVAIDLGIPVAELLRACQHCHYAPPAGYQCMRCGTPAAASRPADRR
jgi:DNA-binding XRE family transcriptional regulator